MFEKIARKHDINAAVSEHVQARARRAEDIDVRRSTGPGIRVQIDRVLCPTADVIDELAVSGPKIQHDISGLDVTLKEGPAQNSPQCLLSRSLVFGETAEIEVPDGFLGTYNALACVFGRDALWRRGVHNSHAYACGR
jgi:hypothetical protein